MYLSRTVRRVVISTGAVKKFNIPSSNNRILSRMPKEFDKEELKKRLTPIQYHITQEKGTERPFTGCYNKFREPGTYLCVVCEQPLFTSETKFNSGCGWPAFKDVIDQGKVKLTTDTSAGMIRTEVTCAECGSHLGHVFDDGPPPTHKRYCINSGSMTFVPRDKKDENEKQAGDS